MSSAEFVLWLQGYMEISGNTPTFAEWQIIKDKVKHIKESDHPFVKPGVIYNAGKMPLPDHRFFLGEDPCESNHK